jgi:hypothetical protein
MAAPIQTVLITAAETTEAGVTDAALELHAFTLNTEDFPGAALPRVTLTGTIGAIVVLLWEFVDGTWGQVFESGAAVTLSATNPQETIRSYGRYAVSKALATTGSKTVVTKAR